MKKTALHLSGPLAVLSLCAAVRAGAAPAAADPCAASPRCFNAGTFIGEVLQVSPSAMVKGARHQVLTLNIRFRNVSDRPIILAYQNASGTGRDNFGNQFFYGRAGAADGSVKGIGVVDSRKADPQFALAPGEARSATFSVIRFNAAPPIGESFAYDVVIDELQIMPGQQIRTLRQNSVTFTNLVPGGFTGTTVGDAGNGAANGAGNEVPAAQAVDVADKMINLFNKLKK